jgi:hypothetical protein
LFTGHKTLVPQLIDEIKIERDDILAMQGA